MSGVSTVTTPVAGRLLVSDADILRRAAEREGVTVSACSDALSRRHCLVSPPSATLFQIRR